MAQKVDVAEVPSGSESAITTVCCPEICTDTEGVSTQNQDETVNQFKTVTVLMEWPIVKSTVDKAQQLYQSLTTSSKLFHWWFSFATLSVRLTLRNVKLIATALEPAIRIADLATSEVAKAVQKKLPVIRQPPAQVAEAVKSKLNDIAAPFVAKVDFVSTGKKRTRHAVKTVIEKYRKLVTTLDKWMEEVENYLDKTKSKGVQATQQQQPTSESEQPQMNAPTLTRRAVEAAAGLGLFYVGASFWLLSRLPLVGPLVDETTSTASSRATSPVRHTEQQPAPSTSAEEASAATQQLRHSPLLPEGHSSEAA